MKGSSSEPLMDVIDSDEFTAKLVELCLKSGLAGFPRGPRDRHILMKSVVLALDRSRVYSASEIGDRLSYWLADIGRAIESDHVSLRRMLVDDKYLERDSGGLRYQASSGGPADRLFSADVESVDVYMAIGEGMKAIAQRKHEYLRKRRDA